MPTHLRPTTAPAAGVRPQTTHPAAPPAPVGPPARTRGGPGRVPAGADATAVPPCEPHLPAAAHADAPVPDDPVPDDPVPDDAGRVPGPPEPAPHADQVGVRRGDAAGGRGTPWVLMYHSVGDAADDPHHVTVTPDRLRRQLTWLRRRGLTGVGVGRLLAARAAGRARGLVGLSFDDGYADFLDEAVPLLVRYGHTATVFVLPGRLGGTNAWDTQGPRKALLDVNGIRAVTEAGMEIGSHGLTHLDLTAVADDVLAAEVAGSRRRLTEITGMAPAGFCYPYGALDARAVRAVREAGYGYACAVGEAPAAGRAASAGQYGQYALPRTYVGERDTAVRLQAKRVRHRLRRGVGV